MMHKRLLPILLFAAAARAEIRLPALISDHMMLQRQMPVRIWGWADPGETVTVSFQSQKVSASATEEGRWQVFLKPLSATAPAELTIIGKANTIQIQDVLVGDVWVASGQSNMEFAMKNVANSAQEIANATAPDIRLFLVKKAVAEKPLDDVQGKWVRCSPETVGPQSAVAYFFAREINEKQHVPVAIINTYWGGTPAQAWTPLATLEADPSLRFTLDDWRTTLDRYPAAKEKYDEALAKYKENKTGPAPRAPQGPGSPNQPAVLYNAMIAPITPYAIRGALWYQGEANASAAHAYIYRHLLSTMIEDWRHAWAQGPFPFEIVQLANYKGGGWWPLLRESQSETLALRNTALAVTIDIGNPTDIHPTNKQDVGHRLALPARALFYGENLVYSGPIFRQMTTEGNIARLWFDSVGQGLATNGDGPLTGFEVAGDDGNYVPARATIDGANILVSSDAVPRPTLVRYAWADVPTANLINRDGLPASPFRNKPGREK